MKLTLSPVEAARVEKCMGTPFTNSVGERVCRCGQAVPFTPDAMWRHTLACEPKQKQAAERDRVRFERERETTKRQLDEVRA